MHSVINKKDIQDHFKKLPKAAREFESFLNLVIEEALNNLSEEPIPSYIRCHKKGCYGIISVNYNLEEDMVHWKCSDCPTGGTISHIFDSELE